MCKLPPEIQESVEKEEEHQGQPEDNPGCPCLLQDIQYVTSDMDSRTACLGRFIYCLILRVLMVIILCNPSVICGFIRRGLLYRASTVNRLYHCKLIAIGG